MSIDAVIHDVRTTDEGLELVLRPRVKPDGTLSLCGQPRLTITHPTWEPPLDVCIWGGDGFVEIVGPPHRQYRRVGYTRLAEEESPSQQ